MTHKTSFLALTKKGQSLGALKKIEFLNLCNVYAKAKFPFYLH